MGVRIIRSNVCTYVRVGREVRAVIFNRATPPRFNVSNWHGEMTAALKQHTNRPFDVIIEGAVNRRQRAIPAR